MGLMDKVKQQAEQALAKAQQGVSQGQAKVDQAQAKRQADALFRDLGAAYYAMQRSGGSADAVDSAMKLVDEHVATHGAPEPSSGGDADPSSPDPSSPGPSSPGPSSPDPSSPGPASSGQAASPPSGTTAGNFSIDDL